MLSEMWDTEFVPKSLLERGWRASGNPAITMHTVHGIDDADKDAEISFVPFTFESRSKNKRVQVNNLAEYDRSVSISRIFLSVSLVVENGTSTAETSYCCTYKLAKDGDSVLWRETFCSKPSLSMRAKQRGRSQ